MIQGPGAVGRDFDPRSREEIHRKLPGAGSKLEPPEADPCQLNATSFNEAVCGRTIENVRRLVLHRAEAEFRTSTIIFKAPRRFTKKASGPVGGSLNQEQLH